jgi:Holliday junction DNA helicase RuvB
MAKKNTAHEYTTHNTIFNNRASHDDTHTIVHTPKQLTEFIGQENLIKKLLIHIHSAKKRQAAADHMLFFGPPGLGKTTLAEIVAHELQQKIRITSAPLVQKTSDIISILNNIKKGDIIFIDEIHRLPMHNAEILYTAMEQFKIDILIGTGNAAKIVTLPLPPFTLIGATTKLGTIPNPLRSRFGIIEKFDWYSQTSLATIIINTMQFYNLEIPYHVALKIAGAARGTPRIAKKITGKIRDYAISAGNTAITEKIIDDALHFFNILPNGLTDVDIELLSILYKKKHPVGLDSLASILNEERHTIEEVYEPFLIQEGYIERTPRGRIIPENKLDDIKHIIVKKTLLASNNKL